MAGSLLAGRAWRRRSVRPGRLAVTVALGALGAGLFLAGSALPAGSTRVVGGNVPVNAGAGDDADISAHNSPTVVRSPADPRRLAVANRIDSPLFSCALHVSGDAGVTWRQVPVPFPEGEELPERCYAPDAAFGADGTLYVTFATLKGQGNVPNAVWLVTSTDGGVTLSPPARVLGPLAFQVRLLADARTPGRLYLSWLQASETSALGFGSTGHPIVFARSDDGGATWKGPVRVTPSSRPRVVAPSPALGPRGELYLLYLDVGDDALDYHGGHQGLGGDAYPGRWSLVLARSLDRGATWQEAVVEGGVVPTERFIAFVPPFPSLAVDAESGKLYAAFQDGRGGDADVWVWASEDGGANFTPPERVNDTPLRDGTSQHLPAVTVAPGGRLDVVYYDRRADPEDVRTEVSLQSSGDGGQSFGRRVRLSDEAFDSRVGFGADNGMPALGSRLGLVAARHRTLAVWADTRAGTEASKKQDLGRAVVAFERRSPLRAPLRAGAVAALGVAVVVLVTAVRRRPVGGHAPAAGDAGEPAGEDARPVPV